MRRRLEALPWITQATVRKLYPGRLEIAIEEREAFARWDVRRLNELGGSLHLLLSIPHLGAH